MKKRVAVIGSGAWGSALAIALSHNQIHTVLWGRDKKHQADLKAYRENRRDLPMHTFPEEIVIESDLIKTLEQVDYIVYALPTDTVYDFFTQYANHLQTNIPICLACKGFPKYARNTQFMFSHDVVKIASKKDIPVAILSGPSFALEVAQRAPTAVTIASKNKIIAKQFSTLFHQPLFRTYVSTDMIGVAVGGALKNVIAIAVGVADGLAMQHNTKAVLLTRGMAEISRFGVNMGGKAKTFLGLSGLGDLVLTAMSDLSRNRLYGKMLTVNNAEMLIKFKRETPTVEGAKTAPVVMRIAQANKIDMPITEQVVSLLAGATTPLETVENLLKRAARDE